jgi:hypothetical protein
VIGAGQLQNLDLETAKYRPATKRLSWEAERPSYRDHPPAECTEPRKRIVT